MSNPPTGPRAPRRKRLRLQAFDYAAPGPYFVTVCTHRRACILGSVVDGEMHPNALGKIVEASWHALPAHFPAARLDAFVVMPNHVHGILLLNQSDASTDRLPGLIRDFKSFSTRGINELRGAAGAPVWQRGYYEHVIRDDKALDEIRRYVHGNPAQWHLDRDNPAAALP